MTHYFNRPTISAEQYKPQFSKSITLLLSDFTLVESMVYTIDTLIAQGFAQDKHTNTPKSSTYFVSNSFLHAAPKEFWNARSKPVLI